jgi:hypothetical protein
MPKKRLTRDRRDPGVTPKPRAHWFLARLCGQGRSVGMTAGHRSDLDSTMFDAPGRYRRPVALHLRRRAGLTAYWKFFMAAHGAERQVEAATTADCARSAWPVRGAEPS